MAIRRQRPLGQCELTPTGVLPKHEALVLYDLYFNLHREHHLHPTLPSCHLPELQRRLAAQAAAGSAPMPGMLTTIARRVAAGRPLSRRAEAA